MGRPTLGATIAGIRSLSIPRIGRRDFRAPTIKDAIRTASSPAMRSLPTSSNMRRFQLPARYRTRVERIERLGRWGSYLVTNHDGSSIVARNVVVATGLHQKPKIPAFSADFPAEIRQLHSDTYRNPHELLPAAVLVVGSAQSGAQIAEELRESGRKVYLAGGRGGRTPGGARRQDADRVLDKRWTCSQ